ncbi:hypothetical protein V1282_004342 [Nitrobacteraceae bacterium AZCC 2146]
MVDNTDIAETPVAGVAQPRQPNLQTWLRFGAYNPLHALIGFFLLALVIASAASAVIFFAAAQFQSRVAELSLNGAPMTIWRVDEFRADFKNWAEDIRRLRDGIAQDQINLAKDKQNNFVLTADQDSSVRRLSDDVRSLKQKVLAASTQGTSSPATGQSETDQNISDVITQTEMLLTRDDLQNRFGADLAAVKKRYDESTELRARIENRQAKIKGYETWIAYLQEQRKDSFADFPCHCGSVGADRRTAPLDSRLGSHTTHLREPTASPLGWVAFDDRELLPSVPAKTAIAR